MTPGCSRGPQCLAGGTCHGDNEPSKHQAFKGKTDFGLDTSGLSCSGTPQRKCQAGSGIPRPGSQREVQARGRHDELYSRLKVKHEHNWHY